MLPRAAQRWLSYSVLERLEAAAAAEIKSHAVLGPIAADSHNNAWAITPAAMLYLWKLVESTEPRRIIEFGSGQSTRLFAAYAARMAQAGRSVSLLSVEHDEHWLEQTQAGLKEEGHADFVQFHHAPLSSQYLLGRTTEAYSIDEPTLARAAGSSGLDLCLIDGPPGTVGRGGCLPLVARYLAAGATVLLDDAFRPPEQAVIREWQEKLAADIKAARIEAIDRHGMLRLTWRGGYVAKSWPASVSTANQQVLLSK
jgi:predicted O-methyltransferase YrrM